MPPRNSRIRPFKPYKNHTEYDLEKEYLIDDWAYNEYEDKQKQSRIGVERSFKNLTDPRIVTTCTLHEEFEKYKLEMAAGGKKTDATINAMIKSEEEEDPRYKNKEWYKLRAAGDPRGWAIDGERCDDRNHEIGRRKGI